MKTKLIYSIPILVLLLASAAHKAAAKDAVQASVIPGEPTASLTIINGNAEYHAGTYSVGTIQLIYIVNAYEFPVGVFGTFQLDMKDVYLGNQGQSPAYPVTLSLNQTGSNNLELTPEPSSHTVDVPMGEWEDHSMVTISIPSGMSNEDGTTLVGNLQMTTPAGSHLGTVTTIQVKIILVHPSTCLAFFHFVTNQDFTEIEPTATVHLKDGVIQSIGGQFSDNVLVVNSCAVPYGFDLQYILDPRTETNPSGNPGNAVFTFVTNAILDPESSLSVLSSVSNAQGQMLCLPNMSAPPYSTFLARVHIGGKSGADPGENPFVFLAGLSEPTAGGGCGAGIQEGLYPDPLYAVLPFVIQENGAGKKK